MLAHNGNLTQIATLMVNEHLFSWIFQESGKEKFLDQKGTRNVENYYHFFLSCVST